MRNRTVVCLALIALATLPVTAQAQRQRLRIEQVRVGFLSSAIQGEYKSGAWAPVYIDIQAPPEGVREGEVSVESSDTDDVRNSYTLPLKALEPNERFSLVSYTRPGSASGEIAVTVKIKDQPTPYTHKENYLAVPMGGALYVVVGSRPVGFLRQLVKETGKQPQADDEDGGASSRDTGNRRLAYIDDLKQMPTRWFAYEGVDLLFLTTGNREFMNALLADNENRREALAEWVRRGGRLVISAGRNQDMLANANLGPALQVLLPAEVTGKVELPDVAALRQAFAGNNLFAHRQAANGQRPPVEIAKLVPKSSRLADATLKEKDDLPLMVKGSYGLGRVALLAFDLDLPPYATWVHQGEMWNRLRTEMNRNVPVQTNQQGMVFGNPYNQDNNNDVAGNLQRSLEDFEDVPVISFGWVALFILVYILIVGPLDYFFLKKVVKRLELTWITFPTVVIAISVAAYFTAYYLKGNDQKINKVDLLDVDLHGQAAFGHAWFTIFSPRIQHYTIGLEPAGGAWAPQPKAGDAGQAYSVVLSWMGRPEAGFGGTGRSGSQSLFRRTYEYAQDAAGLRGVPIQVWTTKSFEATWESPLDPAKPLFSADVRKTGKEGDEPTGTITSRLPVDLEDVYLCYNGRAGVSWYPLDRLVPDTAKRVDSVLKGDTKLTTKSWLDTGTTTARMIPQARRPSNYTGTSEPAVNVVRRILFHEAGDQNTRGRNTVLRHLDQTYRLLSKDELILVGRVVRKEGAAEDVTQDAAVPTRLWLGDLPAAMKQRPVVSGTMTQDTYVRVFIPIRAAKEE